MVLLAGMHQTTMHHQSGYIDISYVGRSHLHSADSLTFDIARTRTRMGDRALSVAGRRAWNALPADIRCAPSLETFKKRLKSHVFSAAYEL